MGTTLQAGHLGQRDWVYTFDHAYGIGLPNYYHTKEDTPAFYLLYPGYADPAIEADIEDHAVDYMNNFVRTDGSLLRPYSINCYKMCAIIDEDDYFQNSSRTLRVIANINGEIKDYSPPILRAFYWPALAQKPLLEPYALFNFPYFERAELSAFGRNVEMELSAYTDVLPTFRNRVDAIAYLNDPTGALPQPTDSPIPQISNQPIQGLNSLTGVASELFVVAEMDQTNLNTLATVMSAGWQTGNIKDGVIFVKELAYPSGEALPAGATEVLINPLGRYSVSGKRINRFQSYHISLGTIDIPEVYGDFVDYSSMCQYKIYLPFAGIFDLDPAVVVNERLTLSCSVDFLSGEIGYYIKLGDRDIYSFGGNCTIDLPITYQDYGAKVASMIQGAASVTATMMAPAVAPLALAQTGIDVLNATQYESSGSIRSNSGFMSIPYPYLIIKKPRIKRPSQLAKFKGLPCNQSGVINKFKGFCKVADVNVDIPGATSDEKEEIEALLKSGVIV